eukprot:3162899-Pyramimonas_sp.AAC.1
MTTLRRLDDSLKIGPRLGPAGRALRLRIRIQTLYGGSTACSNLLGGFACSVMLVTAGAWLTQRLLLCYLGIACSMTTPPLSPCEHAGRGHLTKDIFLMFTVLLN